MIKKELYIFYVNFIKEIGNVFNATLNFFINIKIDNDLIIGVAAILATFYAISIPLVASFSDLETIYGNTITELIFKNNFSRVALKYSKYVAFLMLLVILNDINFHKLFYVKLGHHFLYGLKNLIVSVVFSIVSFFGFYKFYNFIKLYVYHLNIETAKEDYSNKILHLSDGEELLGICNIRISIEEYNLKNLGIRYGHWKDSNILELIEKIRNNYISTAKKSLLTSLGTLLTASIYLIPKVYGAVSRLHYNQYLNSLISLVNIILNSKIEELRSVAIVRIEDICQVSLEQIDNNISSTYIMAQRFLLINYENMTYDVIDEFYRIFSYFYGLVSIRNHDVAVDFLRNMYLNPSLSYCPPPNFFENKGVSEYDKIRSYLQDFDSIIINDHSKLNQSERDEYKKELVNRYYYILMKRMVYLILANLAFLKKWDVIIDIFELHNPSYSRARSLGEKFLDSNIVESCAKNPIENDRYFLGEVVSFLGGDFYLRLIAIYILYETYNSKFRPNSNNKTSLKYNANGLGIYYLNKAKDNIDKINSLLQIPEIGDCLKLRFMINSDDFKELLDSSKKLLSDTKSYIVSQVSTLTNSGSLSNIIYDKYKREVTKYEQEFMNKLPLYKNRLINPNLQDEIEYIDILKRTALMDDSGDNWFFGGGYSVIQNFHLAVAYCYLYRYGEPLSKLKHILSSLTNEDTIFILSSDLESLSEYLGCEVYNKIYLDKENKITADLYCIPTSDNKQLGKYWVYNGKSALISSPELEFLVSFESPEEENDVVHIRRLCCLSVIDEEIDDEVYAMFRSSVRVH